MYLDGLFKCSWESYSDVVGIDVVTPVLVVWGLKLKSRMIIGQDICESVFGSVHGQIRCSTYLISSNSLQLFKLFGKSKVRVCRHVAVVVGEIFELYWAPVFWNVVRFCFKLTKRIPVWALLHWQFPLRNINDGLRERGRVSMVVSFLPSSANPATPPPHVYETDDENNYEGNRKSETEN